MPNNKWLVMFILLQYVPRHLLSHLTSPKYALHLRIVAGFEYPATSRNRDCCSCSSYPGWYKKCVELFIKVMNTRLGLDYIEEFCLTRCSHQCCSWHQYEVSLSNPPKYSGIGSRDNSIDEVVCFEWVFGCRITWCAPRSCTNYISRMRYTEEGCIELEIKAFLNGTAILISLRRKLEVLVL